MVGLVPAPAIHHDDHLAVIDDALTAIGAIVIRHLAALIARRNVGLRLLLCHDSVLRSESGGARRRSLNTLACIIP